MQMQIGSVTWIKIGISFNTDGFLHSSLEVLSSYSMNNYDVYDSVKKIYFL